MTPLAIAAGNSRCASRVKGYDNAANIAGGITSRKLGGRISILHYKRNYFYLPVHRQVMVNTVQHEMKSQRGGMIRKVEIQMEEEAV